MNRAARYLAVPVWLLVGLGLSCDRRVGEAPERRDSPAQATDLIEIQLQLPQAETSFLLRVGMAPPPSSDTWVPALAGAVNAALDSCWQEATGRDPAAVTDLTFNVDNARLAPVGADVSGDGPRACIARLLRGTELPGLGDEPRQLRLRIQAKKSKT